MNTDRLADRYATLREISHSGDPRDLLTQEVRRVLEAVDAAERRIYELEEAHDEALAELDERISDADLDATLEEIDAALGAMNKARTRLLR